MWIVRQPETKNREGQLLTISLPVTLKRVPRARGLLRARKSPSLVAIKKEERLMTNSIADVRPEVTSSLDPITRRLQTASSQRTRKGILTRLRSIALAVTVATALIPGVAAPLVTGGPLTVQPVITHVVTSTGPALAVLRLGTCPGGNSPCP
jgi:hypothetical protein